MLRKIIAIALVVTVLFVSTPKPAYANSDSFGFDSQPPIISEVLGANVVDFENFENTVVVASIWEDAVQAYQSDPFLHALIDEAATTLGTAIGGALVCYGINSAVAPVFPPAAALIPFCSSFSAVSGGGNILQKGLKLITP
ncbi:MAG: hypothetical protein ACLFT0_10105 [Spirulinaceae cyanobacterium]